MRRIISVLMENEPGALSRVVGLFSQRGYNIETLNVAPTEDPTMSRLTLTTIGDDHKIEQITKHLNRLVDVVKLVDLSEGAHIERETPGPPNAACDAHSRLLQLRLFLRPPLASGRRDGALLCLCRRHLFMAFFRHTRSLLARRGGSLWRRRSPTPVPT